MHVNATKEVNMTFLDLDAMEKIYLNQTLVLGIESTT